MPSPNSSSAPAWTWPSTTSPVRRARANSKPTGSLRGQHSTSTEESMRHDSFQKRFGIGLFAGILLVAGIDLFAQNDLDVMAHVPARAPRTAVLPEKRQAFRDYCTTGEGAKAVGKIKADFDRDYLRFPFPAEPLTYGDPEPELRTSDKADKWRAAQDVCGEVSGAAEAAA